MKSEIQRGHLRMLAVPLVVLACVAGALAIVVPSFNLGRSLGGDYGPYATTLKAENLAVSGSATVGGQLTVGSCVGCGGGGGISGLTTNTIPKATSSTTIGNSSVADNGTTVTATGGRLSSAAASSSTSQGNDQVNVAIQNTDTTNNNWESLLFVTGSSLAASIDVQNIDTTNHYGDVNFSTRAADGFLTRLKIASSGAITAFFDLTVSGATTVGNFRHTVVSTTATGTQNDWAPAGNATATMIVNTASSTLTVNGLVGGVDGRKVTIYNNGTGDVIIANGAAGSTPANRFANTGGASTTTLYGASFADVGDSAEFTYFAVDSRWHQTGLNATTVPQVVTATGAKIASNGNLTGVATLIATSVNGTTVTTGGFGGSTWSRGSGVPAISCAIGDLFSRIDGSTSTTLYVCTAINTWTAK